MLAALNHPNVLRFYGVVTASASEQTVVGIMTEYMPGGSLSNYLRCGPPPPPPANLCFAHATCIHLYNVLAHGLQCKNRHCLDINIISQ